MQKKKRITLNIIYNFSYQVLALIIPLVTAPYLSRTLGVDGVGTFSYVNSVSYYFYILIALGLTNYGNRMIAKCADREERTRKYWSIRCMQLLTGAIVMTAYGIYTAYFAEAPYRRLFLVNGFYVVSAALDANWCFFGLQKFRMTALRSAAVRLATLVCVFVFVKGDGALIKYTLIVSMSHFISALVLLPSLHRYVGLYRPSMKEVLSHIRPNLILFIPILAISIYRVMDKIMIKNLAGITQNGYYENADKIIVMVLTVFTSAATVMMPAVSETVARGEDGAVRRMLRIAMQIVSALSIGMAFGLVAVSGRFAPLFFGEAYLETGVLLALLSPTVFLSAWKGVLRSQYLIPYEKDKSYTVSLLAGAAVNVVLNAIFIPSFGARGAVIGTIAAELTGFVIQTAVTSRGAPVRPMFRDALFCVPCGAAMGVVVYRLLSVLPYHILSVFMAVAAGACLYACFLGAVLYLFERRQFRKTCLAIINRRSKAQLDKGERI